MAPDPAPATIQRPPIPTPEELRTCTIAQLEHMQNDALNSTRNTLLYSTLNDKRRRLITDELLRRQKEAERSMGPFIEIIKRTINITRDAQVLSSTISRSDIE